MLYITILKRIVMYRSRLGGDLGDITLDYVSSVSEDAEIAGYDITGSQAHVVMLYQNGIISRSDAKRILGALEEIKSEELGKGRGPEDIHELIEAEVIKRAGSKSGGRMHTARSRNDQVALDMRMKIRDDTNILCSCILDTAEALVSVAHRHRRTVMPLYTHLQQAQAGTFSHYLLAHADALLRDFERFSDSYARVNQSPLGAGPVGGTSIRIDRDSTAEMLGFAGLVENSIDATSTRDFVAEFVGNAAIMMTNLSRLAEDFVIWSTAEFSFVELSDEFASPSSVMPQKKNPDVMELTRGKTAEVIGDLMGVLATVKGLATGYGRDLQQIKSSVWSTSRTSIAALLVVKSMLLTATINEKRMKKAADRGHIVALDVAEKLVQNKVPFRTAHEITGRLVQRAHAANKRLSGLERGEIGEAIGGAGVEPGLVREAIGSASILSSLRGRTSRGSSGFAEQKRMISQRGKRINAYREKITGRDNDVRAALDALKGRVLDLTG